MLLDAATRAGIANGTIRTVYRRWITPRVKAGSTFKTPIGVVAGSRAAARCCAQSRETPAPGSGLILWNLGGC